MEATVVDVSARGKRIAFSKHAAQAMGAERPMVRPWDVADVLEHPHEDTREFGARKRIGARTIIVRYVEDEETIHVRTVSATRRR
jgi:hypothetical protein